MCQQCSTEAVDYGEFIPGWSLVRATKDYRNVKRGDWGLTAGGDPECWWPSEFVPLKDPMFGLTSDEMDRTDWLGDEICDRFWEVTEKVQGKLFLDPLAGHDLVQDAKTAGFDRRQHFLTDWLVHKMALLIEERIVFHNSVELQLEPPC